MIPGDGLITNCNVRGESEGQIANEKAIEVKVEPFQLIPKPIKGRLSIKNMTFHFSDARS